MIQLIEQLHSISTKHELKLAPEKIFLMLPKVEFLGHEIGYNTIKPIYSKVDAFHKFPSPTSTVARISFIGALSFFILSKNFIIILNLFMINYTRILRGHGLLNMKLYFTN